MDEQIFEDCVRRALASTEIGNALQRLSHGEDGRRQAIAAELTDHVRAGWPAMRSLVTAEADAYESAASATPRPVLRSAAGSRVLTLRDIARAQEGLPPIDEERGALIQALLERAVLPAIREWISEAIERARPYRLRFDTKDTSGLRQLSAPEHELSTVAFRRLKHLMGQIGGGAIGISGPRGIGKSTLIRSACGDPLWFGSNRGTYGVPVPAPVEYVPRDFLLHLFAELCLRVAPGAEDQGDPPAAPALSPRLFLSGGVIAAIAGVTLLAAALTASDSVSGTVAGVALVVAVAAGMVALRPRLRALGTIRRLRWLLRRAIMARDVVDTRAGLIIFVLSVFATEASLGGWLTGTGPALPTYLAIGGVAACAVVGLPALSYLRQLLSTAAFAGLAATAALMVATVVVGGPPVPGRRSAVVFYLVAAAASGARAALVRLAPIRPLLMAHVGLVTVTLAAITAGLAVSAAAAWSTPVHPGYPWGALLLALGFALAVPQSNWWDRDERPRPDHPHVARTRAELRRIRFQQTVTTGWSEAVKIGPVPKTAIAVERTVTGGTTLARVPLTYPEIVGAFHAYVRSLTADGSAVVIGIDELDKLVPEAAVRFMNEFKAIFDGHVPGCYYLVSISEEALAGFAQRGLPTRDVFDTAFDEMLRLDYLSYENTVAMLGKRMIDPPRGITALCHALAGGLPRDVIRAVRLADAARGGSRSDLIASVARAVCDEELRVRLQGLRTAARSLPDWRQVVEVTDWADQRTLADLADLAALPKGVDAPEAVALLHAHAASVYHLTTVAAFFATATEADLERVESADPGAGVETLARARGDMAASWMLAWRGVTAFRTAWGMPVTDPPEGPS